MAYKPAVHAYIAILYNFFYASSAVGFNLFMQRPIVQHNLT